MTLGLPEALAAVIVIALNAYVLMGGADFGGGVWDLLARGPRGEPRRKLIARTIAPIWEANHVWLIVSIVVLFTAFPAAFAELSALLHIPLAFMLIGIVLRGSAFVFRSYGSHGRAEERRWGRVFAIASVITPLFLGMVVGAIASGGVGRAAARAGAGSFREIYVDSWFSAFPIMVGMLALTLFAFLAAVYLTVAPGGDDLRESFRRSALQAQGAVFATALGTLGLAHGAAAEVREALTRSGWALPLLGGAAAAAFLVIGALVRRRWRLARFAAAAQVSIILWGWVLSQYPFLVPPQITIRAAAAPPITLRLLLVTLAAGAVVLVPSLWYLFRTFARDDASRGSGQGAEPI